MSFPRFFCYFSAKGVENRVEIVEKCLIFSTEKVIAQHNRTQRKKHLHIRLSSQKIYEFLLQMLFSLAGSPSQSSLRDARFPFLSPAVTSSPGRGKSFLKVGAFGSPCKVYHYAKASPFGRGVTVGDGEGEPADLMHPPTVHCNLFPGMIQ